MLIFNNYSDNQEFSWKHQERINRVTNGTVTELIDRFKQYIQQDQVHSNWKEWLYWILEA